MGVCNVRVCKELEHAVERAVIMCDSDILEPKDFLLLNYSDTSLGADEIIPNQNMSSLNVNELERNAIQQSVIKNNGNLSKASEELGIGRTTLYRKMKKYDL